MVRTAPADPLELQEAGSGMKCLRSQRRVGKPCPTGMWTKSPPESGKPRHMRLSRPSALTGKGKRAPAPQGADAPPPTGEMRKNDSIATTRAGMTTADDTGVIVGLAVVVVVVVAAA